MPSSRSSVTARPCVEKPASAPVAEPECRVRQVRRARDVVGRAKRRGHRPVCGDVVQPGEHQRALALRLRHHFQGDFRHHRQRAPRPRQQLAEIVAGDVLHHPAAGLETVAEAGHRMRAEEMIARAAGLDAAGTGEPRADHAADGAVAGRAQQRGSVHRLEGELLVLGIDQRLHVGERGPRLHRDDELVRLVGGDGIEAERSSTALVAIGWPIARLVPWPMISSG